MKKLIIVLFGVILLSACNDAQKVSDDENVYVVDSAYVKVDRVTFFFRNVENPVEVPLEKCKDVPITNGVVVLVDDDLNMSANRDHDHGVWLGLFLSAIIGSLVTLLVSLSKL